MLPGAALSGADAEVLVFGLAAPGWIVEFDASPGRLSIVFWFMLPFPEEPIPCVEGVAPEVDPIPPVGTEADVDPYAAGGLLTPDIA